MAVISKNVIIGIIICIAIFVLDFYMISFIWSFPYKLPLIWITNGGNLGLVFVKSQINTGFYKFTDGFYNYKSI